METLTIDIQNDQEKKVLIAFLDSLNYQYRTESGYYVLTDEQVQEVLKRKDDFLSGKTASRKLSESRFAGL